MGLSSFNKQGPNFVPAYQVSGVPFVTSSAPQELSSATAAVNVRFPYVTRWFEITNTGSGTLRFGFSRNGVLGSGAASGSNIPETEKTANHNNYYVISGSSGNSPSTVRLELRCKELFLSSFSGEAPTGFSIVAGLTGVEKNQFPNLTGSNGFWGVG